MSNGSTSRRRSLLGVSSILLALFAAGAVVLSSTVPALWIVAQRSEREREAAISDACAAMLGGQAPDLAALDVLRQRYRLEAIEVQSSGGGIVRSGIVPPAGAPTHVETRSAGAAIVRIHFAEEALRHIART
ncbi:MAG: hypothetical protein WB973_13130, partial [Thermoanaerobaculia bacterium]